jgi:hypothetical protein
MSASRMSKSPADFLGGVGGGGGGGTPGATTPNGGSMFVPRENPRRLFVRDALPSTEAATTTAASPALGGTPGGLAALRTPGASLRITPGRRGDDGAGGSGGGGDHDGGFALAENGFRRGGGSDGGVLSDAQLSALLPTLKQPDYYTEPSLAQVRGWCALGAVSLERHHQHACRHLAICPSPPPSFAAALLSPCPTFLPPSCSWRPWRERTPPPWPRWRASAWGGAVWAPCAGWSRWMCGVWTWVLPCSWPRAA